MQQLDQSKHTLQSSPPLTLPFTPERIIGVLQQAAEIVHGIIARGGLKVTTKSDGSFVTNADIAVHDFLVVELPKLFDALVISEEGIPELAARRSTSVAWLIDPVDNTKALVEGHLEKSSINVALLIDGAPVLGMVHYFGEKPGILGIKGSGAFSVIENELQPLEPQPLGDPLRFVAYRDTLAAMGEDTRILHDRAAPEGATLVMRNLLPLRLHAIMTGAGDVYIEPRSLNEWDIVPAFAVMAAIGGCGIAIDDGSPIVFNSESLKAKPFMLARQGVNAPQLIERMRGASNTP